MDPTKILLNHVYTVWMSRRQRPILIRRKRSDGLFEGIAWPHGKLPIKLRESQIAGEFGTMTETDFKSRAAGERE